MWQMVCGIRARKSPTFSGGADLIQIHFRSSAAQSVFYCLVNQPRSPQMVPLISGSPRRRTKKPPPKGRPVVSTPHGKRGAGAKSRTGGISVAAAAMRVDHPGGPITSQGSIFAMLGEKHGNSSVGAGFVQPLRSLIRGGFSPVPDPCVTDRAGNGKTGVVITGEVRIHLDAHL